MNPLRVVVWNDLVQQRRDPAVGAVYPEGIHQAIAAGLRALLPAAEVTTATLGEPEQGLAAARLAATDVLVWW